jgi:PAS domain S-box-containing protein
MNAPSPQERLKALLDEKQSLTDQIDDYESLLVELKRQLENFEQIFASLPIMIWHKDTKNRHVRVNPAAAQMEGSTPEEINGKSAEEIYPPEQAAAYYADDLEVIESGEPKLNIIEKHVSTERNEEMWAQVGKVPVRDRSGDIVGITVFAVDITDAKRAEEALQAAHSELEQKNQQLERAQEVFRSTLEQISEVVERSADAVELRRYLRDAREEFDRL